LEVICPGSVPVGIFSTHPTNKITVDGVEARESASKKIGSCLIESGFANSCRGRPDETESQDGDSACADSEMDIGAPGATDLVARPAIVWSKESPYVGKDADNREYVVVCRATGCWYAESPEATTIRCPRPRIP
jgi:hypothetical protein